MRVVVVLLILFCSTAHAQRPGFGVGPVTAESGTMASGFLEVPAGVDESTRIPVTVLQGRNDGPVIAFVAGTHGYEYAPMLALQKLRERIDPAGLSGTVIFVHVANMPSFLGRTIYYSPVDGKNLNRAFPGKPDGTSSERIAYALTREVIERSDYVIDAHSGDGNESLRHFTYWVSGDAPVNQASREMALAFGIDHIVVDEGRETDPSESVFLDITALSRGKPALTIESGFLGVSDPESIERVERGVISVLRHLGMLPGEPDMVEHPVWLDPTEVVRSEATGMFRPMVERGHSVVEGSVLGVVTDFFGREIYRVRAPFAGTVLYVIATPPISEGEPVAMIGVPKP